MRELSVEHWLAPERRVVVHLRSSASLERDDTVRSRAHAQPRLVEVVPIGEAQSVGSVER